MVPPPYQEHPPAYNPNDPGSYPDPGGYSSRPPGYNPDYPGPAPTAPANPAGQGYSTVSQAHPAYLPGVSALINQSKKKRIFLFCLPVMLHDL